MVCFGSLFGSCVYGRRKPLGFLRLGISKPFWRTHTNRCLSGGTIWDQDGATWSHLGGPWGRRCDLWRSKTHLIKSLFCIAKNRVLGTWGSKMEPKGTPKVVFFWVLKSYEFIAKNRVRRNRPQHKIIHKNQVFVFCQNLWFFTTYGFTLAKLTFVRFKERFFQVFWVYFLVFFLDDIFWAFSWTFQKTL